MTTAYETAPGAGTQFIDRFMAVRRATDRLCAPLSAEDCQIQSMPDASPVKWHLAHTTWFFETFVLAVEPKYRPFDPQYSFLFNSYYEAVGARHPRPRRGILSRPTLQEVLEYRAAVDERMRRLLSTIGPERFLEIEPVLALGLHHEQQHQELILTDVQHVLSLNPLRPAYCDGGASGWRQPPGFFEPFNNQETDVPRLPQPNWVEFSAGVKWIGHGGQGFAFDNESPRHRVWLDSYRMAARLTTCGEFLRFMDDGGYSRPQLWLSDGWVACCTSGWTCRSIGKKTMPADGGGSACTA